MRPDRIIQLLEIEHECMLRGSHGDCDRKCEDCELVQDDYDLHEMYLDAIAIVKDSAPRLLAVDEIVSQDGAVFIEYNENMVSRPSEYVFCNFVFMGEARFFDKIGKELRYKTNHGYGKTWRCWTKRPSEDQRKDVIWDE